MRLLVRFIDEVRFGLRDLDLEELRTVASIWSCLNDGLTPSEAVLRLMKNED